MLAVLRKANPEINFDTVNITPTGDRHKNAPLNILERGTFVKDLETALLTGVVDFAVHSAKDMPSNLPQHLNIAAFTKREDPRDILIDHQGRTLDQLPSGAKLGTSSPRRASQIKHAFPKLNVLPIRGNIETRISKANGTDCDGVILAASGLSRLNRTSDITEYLSTEFCTPDAGQGALIVETRSSDTALRQMLSSVDHYTTRITVTAEREFMSAIGGGCQVPVAAYATLSNNIIKLSVMAGLPNGSQLFRANITSNTSDLKKTGKSALNALVSAGARDILFEKTNEWE